MKTACTGFVAALMLLGCGGGDAEGASGDETAGGESHHGEGHHGGGHHGGGHHGEGHHGGEEHEHAMPEHLRPFHDVLAPVYHLEPGAGRAEASCAAVEEMRPLADGVSHDTVGAVEQLGAACDAGELDEAGVASVEQALEAVHDAFHREMLVAQE